MNYYSLLPLYIFIVYQVITRLRLIDRIAGFEKPYQRLLDKEIDAAAWLDLKRCSLTSVNALFTWIRYKDQVIIDFVIYGRGFADCRGITNIDKTIINGKSFLKFKERIKIYKISHMEIPSELPHGDDAACYWGY